MKKRIIYDFVTDSGMVFRREYITKDATDYKRVKIILNNGGNYKYDKYILVSEEDV